MATNKKVFDPKHAFSLEEVGKIVHDLLNRPTMSPDDVVKIVKEHSPIKVKVKKEVPEEMDLAELKTLQKAEDKEAGIRDRAATKDKNKHLQIERYMDLPESYKESRILVLKHSDPVLAEAHLQSVISGVHLYDR
jgi:hypothetical protein